MGNILAHCMLHPSAGISVIRADGEMLEFDNPILTKQLMKTYPGHLVVHCTTIAKGQLGQRSKVYVMRPEDALVRRQTYCLLSVQPQGARILSSRGPSGMSNSGRQQSGEIGRTSSSRLTLRSLFGVNDLQISDQVLDDMLLKQLQQQPALAAHHQQGPRGPWRPALDVIMESPSRSLHSSVTMSPLARQACYIPASHTAMLAQPKVVVDTSY